jgi:hypothetical protein
MDLIANIIAWILTFIASVVGNILAHDICTSADRTCAMIIHNAASRLAHFDRESGELEWLADLYERQTVSEKYRHAIGCFLVAGKMRREATTVTVAMNFQITGVGAVPLTLSLTSRFMWPTFTRLMSAKYTWIKHATVLTAMLYVLVKFIRSARRSLSPEFKITREHIKQYKSWGYDAHIKRKGMDLHVNHIFRAMVLQPQRIPKIIKKVNDALAPLRNTQSAPST